MTTSKADYVVGDLVQVLPSGLNPKRKTIRIDRIFYHGDGTAKWYQSNGTNYLPHEIAGYAPQSLTRDELMADLPMPGKSANERDALADTQFHDTVNHPSHYTAYPGIEVIQLTEHMNFCRGNAVKYVARAGLKDKSKEVEDLEKAVWYLNREIQRLKETPDGR